MKIKQKQERKSLSIMKLYKMAYGFIKQNPKVDMSVVASFIEYVNKHKYDNF